METEAFERIDAPRGPPLRTVGTQTDLKGNEYDEAQEDLAMERRAYRKARVEATAAHHATRKAQDELTEARRTIKRQDAEVKSLKSQIDELTTDSAVERGYAQGIIQELRAEIKSWEDWHRNAEAAEASGGTGGQTPVADSRVGLTTQVAAGLSNAPTAVVREIVSQPTGAASADTQLIAHSVDQNGGTVTTQRIVEGSVVTPPEWKGVAQARGWLVEHIERCEELWRST